MIRRWLTRIAFAVVRRLALFYFRNSVVTVFDTASGLPTFEGVIRNVVERYDPSIKGQGLFAATWSRVGFDHRMIPIHELRYQQSTKTWTWHE